MSSRYSLDGANTCKLEQTAVVEVTEGPACFYTNSIHYALGLRRRFSEAHLEQPKPYFDTHTRLRLQATAYRELKTCQRVVALGWWWLRCKMV